MISYWKKGCNYLLKRDPLFREYYNPNHYLKTNKNKFDVLFKSICSQQISVNAAMSIYKKTKLIMEMLIIKTLMKIKIKLLIFQLQ